MEGIELVSFQIITMVGDARSSYIEAIREARLGNFDNAEELINKGNKSFLEGHTQHAKLLQSEANGKVTDIGLLLIHAEDQLMSAEDFKILAIEFIELYKLMYKK